MSSGRQMWRRGAIPAMLTWAAVTPVVAQDTEEAEAPSVVVTGTRVEQKSFDLPMAINAIGQQQIQGEGKPMVNISEQLNRVPGTVVQSRETFGQEQQITLRGFGARSQFGVRGIKLLADEIPASTPDGQGGTGLFDLASAKRIEVLRGPFSALYGNHSGGVVQIFTEDGPTDPTLTASLAAGSYDSWRVGLKFGGQAGALNYVASASRFETDGYRVHSSARKDQFNSKLRVDVAEQTNLTLVFNYLDQPNDEDPLGMDAAQLATDRRGVIANALTFNTRRSLSNMQLGGVLETKITSSDTLRFLAYVGERSNEGYLGIPLTGTGQLNIRSAGGVTVFDRQFGGAGVRWTHQGQLAQSPVTVTVGADYDLAEDDRKGYLNLNGVRGDLKRDEINTVDSWGAYVQGELLVSEPLSLSAGLRYTRVGFESEDHFICASATGLCASATLGTSNPDDSGSVSYSAFTPVVGALYRLSPGMNLYANVGKSFETPTLIELAYRTDGGAGLNFSLEPSESIHYEIGAKAIIGADTRVDLALFRIDTNDEIVVFSNTSGRSTFRNASDTRRYGVEVAVDSNLPGGLAAFLSATWLQAEYQDSFLTCATTGCNLATSANTTTVQAGNKIPGVPETTIFAELAWKYSPVGFTAGIEGRYVDKIQVNDINSETADSYFVMAVRAGLEQRIGKLRIKEFVRVDNLLDEEYVAGVYVNDTNRRFYAPAAERTFFGGVTVTYAF